MAAWFAFGGIAGSARAVEAAPSAFNTPAPQDAQVARLIAKYGSRYMCEAKREQAVQMWQIVGGGIGILGGLALERALNRGDEYSPLASAYFAGGALIGLGMGWGLGQLFAPDCSMLPWTEKSLESWKQWKAAEKTWLECQNKRNWTIGLWTAGGTLVCGLAGGFIAASNSKTGEEGGAFVTLLGVLVGGAVGSLLGWFVGEQCAPKCDSNPPGPEMFMQSEQPVPVIPAPLAPSPVSATSPVR